MDYESEVPATSTTAISANGFSLPRADGAVQVQAIKDHAAVNPNWKPFADAWHFPWEALADYPDMTEAQKNNYIQNSQLTFRDEITADGFNLEILDQACDFNAEKIYGGNYPQLPDAFAWPKELTLARLPEFFANGEKRYETLRSVNDPDAFYKSFPIIDHEHFKGVVAGEKS